MTNRKFDPLRDPDGKPFEPADPAEGENVPCRVVREDELFGNDPPRYVPPAAYKRPSLVQRFLGPTSLSFGAVVRHINNHPKKEDVGVLEARLDSLKALEKNRRRRHRTVMIACGIFAVILVVIWFASPMIS